MTVDCRNGSLVVIGSGGPNLGLLQPLERNSSAGKSVVTPASNVLLEVNILPLHSKDDTTSQLSPLTVMTASDA